MKQTKKHPAKAAKNKNLFLCGGVVAAALAVVVIVMGVTELFGGGSVQSKVEKLEGFTPIDEKNLTMGAVLSDSQLSIEAVGMYTGEYMEDGSDEAVEDVGALVISNESEQMLQIAEIELTMEDGNTAQFRLTNLPSKGTALVLDMNRLAFSKESKIQSTSDATQYFEEVPMEESLDAEGTEGRITLKNTSDETHSVVYVYYKTTAGKDLYLGGITYRVPFEEIQGKTQIDSDAGHYSPDKSEIVEIQSLDEDAANQGQREEEE